MGTGSNSPKWVHIPQNKVQIPQNWIKIPQFETIIIRNNILYN